MLTTLRPAAAFCFLLQTMTQDIVAVWQQVFGSSTERVPTLLVGHSMGGALAVWSAATKAITGLDGVVVIDVVEGTAIGKGNVGSYLSHGMLCSASVRHT
jgi:pimeloyl-ACP methyl ester carboxylesterase